MGNEQLSVPSRLFWTPPCLQNCWYIYRYRWSLDWHCLQTYNSPRNRNVTWILKGVIKLHGLNTFYNQHYCSFWITHKACRTCMHSLVRIGAGFLWSCFERPKFLIKSLFTTLLNMLNSCRILNPGNCNRKLGTNPCPMQNFLCFFQYLVSNKVFFL